MPGSSRSRPLRTNGAHPANEATTNGERRSRRLRHDEPDQSGLPLRKRRRRKPQSDEEGLEDEAAEAAPIVSEDASSRQANTSNSRKKVSWQHAIDESHHANLRNATANTLPRQRRVRKTRLQRRKTPFSYQSSAEPKNQDRDHNKPLNPPRGSRRNAGASQQEVESSHSGTEDELFVPQEEHGDTQLYDDPTDVEDEHDEGQEKDSNEQQNQHPLRVSLVWDDQAELDEIYSIAPDSQPANFDYPEAHLLFFAPTGNDRATAVPLKSKALKSMVELMNRSDWKSSTQLGSKWSIPYWKELRSLHAFWGFIPQAPRYDEQGDYIHSYEGAAKAKVSIQRIDELIEGIVKHTHKTASDKEELGRIMADVHGAVIPKMVTILHAVFRVGASDYSRAWCAMVTNLTMQIMNRILAWIRHLSVGYLQPLMPMNQRRRTMKVRELLRRYTEDLQVEFDDALKQLHEVSIRRREYEEKQRRFLQREEGNRQREEERTNWQYENAYRRIKERYGPRDTEPSHGSRQTLASGQTESSPSFFPNLQQRGLAKSNGGNSWSYDDKMRLLKILKKTPNPHLKFLSWDFGCSEEDVGIQMEQLKKATRDTYLRKNQPVPDFARV